MNTPFSMVIQWSEDDQSYVVTLPEFGPYAKTHGDTYEEAARKGQEVIEMLIDTYRTEGKPLPVPAKFGVSIPASA